MNQPAQLDTRIADMQTSLAVLASSSQTRDEQIRTLTKTLEKHTEREEKLIDKIFGKLNETKETCDKKHVEVGVELAGYRGALTGSRWLLGVMSALISISLFLGLKPN